MTSQLDVNFANVSIKWCNAMSSIVTSNGPLQVRSTCHGMENYAMYNLKNNNVDVDSNSTSFKMEKNPNQRISVMGHPHCCWLLTSATNLVTK